MRIRTFRGRTVADALSQVKRALGGSAVILNARTYRTGGFFGLGARTITEVTASDRPPAHQRAAMPASRRTPRPPGTSPLEAGDGRPPSASRSAQPESAEASIKQVARMIVSATARTPVEEELSAIRRMVEQVLRSTHAPAQPALPEALFDCYRRLLESAVASEIASEVAGRVRDDLSREQLADPDQVRRAALRRLAAYIPVCESGERISRAADGRPTTIALVGPTGVGKTTTIAKLAATYRLKQGRRVGLITCDTYRIAAVEQLRTYAGIMNLPLRVVITPAEMRSACAAMGDCDVLLIDTAGRPPRGEQRIDELRALVAAAIPHQVHLVLSSASAEDSLVEAARRFAPLACDRVIMTKLDEAVNFGVVVNVLHKLGTRLSFVTTGQDVPDHIETVSPDRLARLVLGTEDLAP